jgi:hypothetical protein
MQKTKGTYALAGALAALLSVCLGLMYAWWHSTGYYLEWGEPRSKTFERRYWKSVQEAQDSNASNELRMQKARNADTSNFDNVLRF